MKIIYYNYNFFNVFFLFCIFFIIFGSLSVYCICEKEIHNVIITSSSPTVPVLGNAAMCLASNGAFVEALKYFKMAVDVLESSPLDENISNELSQYLYNIAFTYQNMNDLDTALYYYQQIINKFPTFYPAYIKAAWIHSQRGEYDSVLSLLRNAININPKEPSTYFYLGNILNNLKHWELAANTYKEGLSVDPLNPQGHLDLADTYTNLKKHEDALEQYNIAFNLNPDNPNTLIGLLQAKRDTCSWGNWSNMVHNVISTVNKEIERGRPSPLSPYSTLFLNITREFQLKVSSNWVGNIIKRSRGSTRGYNGNPYHNYPEGTFLINDYNNNSNNDDNKEEKEGEKEKIRIGYISRKFEEYAGAQLCLSIFGLHDRNNFEVYSYAHGPSDGSREREKIQQDSDMFRDIHLMSNAEAARVISQDKIHILISFDGIHSFNSFDVLALRPAPIQISFLGFAGTTGATLIYKKPQDRLKEPIIERVIDFLITDTIVTPLDEINEYSERLLVLPPSYQPQDDSRGFPRGDPPLYRSHPDIQLPPEAVVYTCFNRMDKIEPLVFKAWMNILSLVPNSVLWLYSDSNHLAEDNLRSEALNTYGIDPNRLFFASKVPVNVYLERLSLADLFLDTWIYNAHTTCSDALWMGLPLLTIEWGHTIASRVAYSLITALGLKNELIASSPEDYINKAVEFGLNSTLLSIIRNKVIEHRDSKEYSLFNSKRYVNCLEKAYTLVMEDYPSCGGIKDISHICKHPLIVE